MLMFIKRPNPVSIKDAEIAQLKSRIRLLEAEKSHAEKQAICAENEASELRSECPDCSDLCFLEQGVIDANYDVLTVQSIDKNELCGTVWPKKFRKKGLIREFQILAEITSATLSLKEYELSLAAYNLAYCKSLDCEEFIESKRQELIELVESNDCIDDRCISYINKILALSA